MLADEATERVMTIGVRRRLNRIAVAILPMALWCASLAADTNEGLLAFDQGDFLAAIELLGPEAQRGDPDAQFALGVIYLNGLGVDPDPERAGRSFRLSAEQGLISAQLELAKLYREGIGVPQDFAEMTLWYGKAALSGDVGAQLFLADAYAYGIGIERDAVRAYAWYSIAELYWGDMIAAAKTSVGQDLDDDQIAKAKSLAAELEAQLTELEQ
jgi:TPR repeat protein